MTTVTDPATGLSYDIEGAGTPVVLLHGMTFDRRTWRPIIDMWDGAVTSIAIDLPGHGGSGGEPTRLQDVAEQIHRLLESLAVERPVVVGHSMGASVAALYASAYPTRGIALVDQATEVLPFARMLHQIAPMLRGPAFHQVWPNIENSLGLDRTPDPTRALVLGTHRVEQDVVLGYWDQILTTDPVELQAWIDAQAALIQVPCLAVFGRPATVGERERFDGMPDVQIEEWVGDGHFVHLVEPGRFATRLLNFLAYCGSCAVASGQVAT
ncbi:alpha/beta fold hydrolase [Streptomyces sp. Da 82-17]|uniref:alpha/beta fold hydrolase n=1 Tax=Streptomyces sp. Da 82-17 TaxID=3377116 RepID=UPI0038D4A32F